MAKGKGFFGLGWVISLVIAIFFFGWIVGALERFKRGNLLGAVLNLFGYGFGILYVCDIVTLILYKDIKVLA